MYIVHIYRIYFIYTVKIRLYGVSGLVTGPLVTLTNISVISLFGDAVGGNVILCVDVIVRVRVAIAVIVRLFAVGRWFNDRFESFHFLGRRVLLLHIIGPEKYLLYPGTNVVSSP